MSNPLKYESQLIGELSVGSSLQMGWFVCRGFQENVHRIHGRNNINDLFCKNVETWHTQLHFLLPVNIGLIWIPISLFFMYSQQNTTRKLTCIFTVVLKGGAHRKRSIMRIWRPGWKLADINHPSAQLWRLISGWEWINHRGLPGLSSIGWNEYTSKKYWLRAWNPVFIKRINFGKDE